MNETEDPVVNQEEDCLSDAGDPSAGRWGIAGWSSQELKDVEQPNDQVFDPVDHDNLENAPS